MFFKNKFVFQKCIFRLTALCPQVLKDIVLFPFFLFSLSLSLLLHHPSIWYVKMADIQKVYLTSLFPVYLCQFQNPALLSSPLLGLLIGSVLAQYFQVELAAPSHQSSVKLHTTGVCFN